MGWYQIGLHSLWVIYDTTRWYLRMVSLLLGKYDVFKVMIVTHGIMVYNWYDHA